MPYKLTTTVKNIHSISNSINARLISEFHQYMITNGSSERHQNNSLKAIVCFARFLGPSISFLEISKKEHVISFLDTKIRSSEQDPEKKSINTWNDYARRIKRFLRWLYNTRECTQPVLEQTDWITPDFANIKEKRTKRISPYSETELWERDEILSIIKYEPFKRNKAAFTLFWDLNARNHEVTLLKIKHVRLRERYGEGEIPHEAKTGTGPILLTCSFPYVRDWLNEHPFRNEPDARLICNLITGAPLKPEAMWDVSCCCAIAV
jgi:hypothetical protein